MPKLPAPFAKKSPNDVPVYLVSKTDFPAFLKKLSSNERDWIKAAGFNAKHLSQCLIPGPKGGLGKILFGFDDKANPLDCGKLSKSLPAGKYKIESKIDQPQITTLGLALGAYQFDRYKKTKTRNVSFVLPDGVDVDRLSAEIDATFLTRDLINTPTNDMGPGHLEKAFKDLAKRFKAKVAVIKGDDLLKKNFPMIHAVGRASVDAPRLLDMKWGKSSDPKITLVGKGVCFDTGGLNIKPGSSMSLMKKDMGGAANVLGLALMIMAANLPVRLRVLIPAVENSISGNAFRPGDILPSRKGISVEIGNTDAEGRLVLGDALAYGDEENPDLMIDMATLTGAARVALGPDLPPFYSDDDGLSADLATAAINDRDPLWRMPLWQPYETMLSSNIADTNHITSGGFAGSITAALFLKKFVNPKTSWVHLDVFGWVPSTKPWASVGGEAQGIRALFAVIQKRFGK